jgi:hypothetical protein
LNLDRLGDSASSVFNISYECKRIRLLRRSFARGLGRSDPAAAF